MRGRAGGRFRVTPKHRLVLVSTFAGNGLRWSLAGQLHSAFEAETANAAPAVAPHDVRPGDPYGGPYDTANGTFKLRQKDGGNIERRTGRAFVWALIVEPGPLGQNARAVLGAWRATKLPGMDFFVSSTEVAWFRENGRAKVLAYVPAGFAWPDPVSGEQVPSHGEQVPSHPERVEGQPRS